MAVESTFISNKISVYAEKINCGSYSNFSPEATAEQMCRFGEIVNSLQNIPYTAVVRTEECRLENWA